jgi:hypothetical protein
MCVYADPGLRLYDPNLQEHGSRFKDSSVMSAAFDPNGRDLIVAGALYMLNAARPYRLKGDRRQPLNLKRDILVSKFA